LVLAGVSGLLACSERTLQRQMRRLVHHVADWSEREQARLGRQMPVREIVACLDENFHQGMPCLVGMEPVSGWLLTEQLSERRDQAAWKAALERGTRDLRVTITQIVADEAKGIAALAAAALQVPKQADLFHGQYALSRATAAPLARAVDAARAALDTTQAAQQAWAAVPHGPGRPPDWAARRARETQALQQAETHREEVRACVRALGEVVHPVDLQTGALRTPAQLASELGSVACTFLETAHEAGIGARAETAMTKVQRLFPTWCAMLTWWQTQARTLLATLPLSTAAALQVWTVLVPYAYLRGVLARASREETRSRVRATLATLEQALRAPDSAWVALPPAQQQQAWAVARECAARFQRASSCVEGRNGYLALRYHQRHVLPAELRCALRTVHNFVIERDDGTTAAERFFGQRPGDLFAHLLAVMPEPSRPRSRERKPHHPSIFAPLRED
jgi:hypothetical protein